MIGPTETAALVAALVGAQQVGILADLYRQASTTLDDLGRLFEPTARTLSAQLPPRSGARTCSTSAQAPRCAPHADWDSTTAPRPWQPTTTSSTCPRPRSTRSSWPTCSIWSPLTAQNLLHLAADAVRPGGAVIIVDAFEPTATDHPLPHAAYALH